MSQDEVAAARAAIEEGDFARARHHINNLALDSRHAYEVQELNRLIMAQENANTVVSTQRIEWSISVCVLGYIILSFRTPDAWGNLAWGLSAFLILPLATGLLAGNSVPHSAASPQSAIRFWRGFLITGITVFLYTFIGMVLARTKMHSSDKASDFLIFFVVMSVYAIIAGVVSGFAGSILPVSRKVS